MVIDSICFVQFVMGEIRLYTCRLNKHCVLIFIMHSHRWSIKWNQNSLLATCAVKKTCQSGYGRAKLSVVWQGVVMWCSEAFLSFWWGIYFSTVLTTWGVKVVLYGYIQSFWMGLKLFIPILWIKGSKFNFICIFPIQSSCLISKMAINLPECIGFVFQLC